MREKSSSHNPEDVDPTSPSASRLVEEGVRKRDRREARWVKVIEDSLTDTPLRTETLAIKRGLHLTYGHEIRSHGAMPDTHSIDFETDLAIVETIGPDRWKPRVVIEAKFGKVTTHDAITYSYKAACHKAVHPYLRYGIMLGGRAHHPLPGRLYRHGSHFDFMFSFTGDTPTAVEQSRFAQLLSDEVRASRDLEKIMYDSRKRGRDRYTLLHRRLVLDRT